ncbi:hypothetical protein BLNAU_13347 [Blattamonas nauphoetae]|uniref:Uncharacterized protein n=1 Tax=Blattamonas nauphoetae TaxID=2049346 RepID=A0ABQ9XKK3_9EUKA|nr:hypothetical protein BLNAU_13347 [Blattamonas nauphoetae]
MTTAHEKMTLLDAIEGKLKDTKRIPFLSRIVLTAKIVDRQTTVDHEIAEYFERIVPNLSAVRRGMSIGVSRGRKVYPSGVLLCMPNSIVQLLEASYEDICSFVTTFALHQEYAFKQHDAPSERLLEAIDAASQNRYIFPRGTGLLSNVRILFFTDDIPERAFLTWTAHSIPKHFAPNPELLGFTEKQVLGAYNQLLALGQLIKTDSLLAPDTQPTAESLITIAEESALPSNEIYLNLSSNPDLPTLDEWADIYACVIDVSMDDEFTWPALSTLNTLPI